MDKSTMKPQPGQQDDPARADDPVVDAAIVS